MKKRILILLTLFLAVVLYFFSNMCEYPDIVHGVSLIVFSIALCTAIGVSMFGIFTFAGIGMFLYLPFKIMLKGYDKDDNETMVFIAVQVIAIPLFLIGTILTGFRIDSLLTTCTNGAL